MWCTFWVFISLWSPQDTDANCVISMMKFCWVISNQNLSHTHIYIYIYLFHSFQYKDTIVHMMIMTFYQYLDAPLVYFVGNRTENNLRCHGKGIPSITNITIFYDSKDTTGTACSGTLVLHLLQIRHIMKPQCQFCMRINHQYEQITPHRVKYILNNEDNDNTPMKYNSLSWTKIVSDHTFSRLTIKCDWSKWK